MIYLPITFNIIYMSIDKRNFNYLIPILFPTSVLGNWTIRGKFWTVLDRFWTLFPMSKTMSKTCKFNWTYKNPNTALHVPNEDRHFRSDKELERRARYNQDTGIH